MSWKTSLAKLVAEFGDDVVERVGAVIGKDASEAEARAAAKRIAKPAPARKAAPATRKPARKAAPKSQKSLAVKTLPAPPKVLALPAPGPGLSEGASKPRGGQFWVDKEIGTEDGWKSNWSPEEAARQAAAELEISQWLPEAENVAGVLNRSSTPASEWLQKALTKYYKTDFGAPDDPLRDLAARGLHYDPHMTPEQWQRTVNDYLMEDDIGEMILPRDLWTVTGKEHKYPGAGDEYTSQVRMAMPWLAKQPVTDKLYGIAKGGLDLGHFTDEFLNALNDPEAAGLPLDFAVRPESLQRMTFPQAVEHVGRINQFRAKEMERAALEAQDSPVLHAFKDYTEDNPRGLRWVEIAPPKGDAPTNYDPEEELQKALKYEGDTMGHCVGGYCPDVMSGQSRIFSLRDAKGEPHVTIETKPRARVYSDLVAHLGGDESLADDYLARGFQARDAAGAGSFSPLHYAFQEAGVPTMEDIIQIKGKQNRAPVDDYLPFVQDFVKSGQWGNVGDLGNTGLVKLPDGRYITSQQLDDIVNSEMLDNAYQSYDFNANRFPRDPSRMAPEDWEQFSRHFEGYAYGGRVDADRCFCHNPLSVRRRAA